MKKNLIVEILGVDEQKLNICNVVIIWLSLVLCRLALFVDLLPGLHYGQQKSNSHQSQAKQLKNDYKADLFAFYNRKFELVKCMSHIIHRRE